MTESRPHTETLRRGKISAGAFQGGREDMIRILDNAQPEEVIKTAKVYENAAAKLQHVAQEIRAQMSELARVWVGDDIDASLKQLERLQKTAENLEEAAKKKSFALANYGDQLKWYKEHKPGEGFVGGMSKGDVALHMASPVLGIAKKAAEKYNLIESAEDEAAREHMDRLIGRTEDASGNLPDSLTTDIPHRRDRAWEDDPKTRIPSSPGGPTGGTPSVPSAPKDPFGAGGTPHVPGGPKDPFDGVGSAPKPGYSGSDLAGVPGAPGGGVGTDPFGRGGIGGGIGGAGGGLGGGIGGLGGAAGAPPGALGGPPGLGRGAGAGAGAGRGLGAGAGRGLGAGARGGAGGMAGGGGAPGGRGGGKGEEEHERSTWLVEDEDVWGASDGDAAPPVIG